MHKVMMGDCLDLLDKIPDESVDLIYLDPPFFTQKVHKLSDRKGGSVFSFADIWSGRHEYEEYMFDRLVKLRSKLKRSGSIFFHCDRSASHMARPILDYIFGENLFRSEIVWYFKRWSNSQKGLLPSHQNIFWYSMSEDYKFNRILGSYSASTNVDQLMQRRVRDERGKAVYERTNDGAVVSSGSKQGVPLSDVWEIPYLNPKAKERVGYPTQKPLLLLERIISLTTDPGDLVLDPFCGSGTSLVASKLLERCSIGIDLSEEAVSLSLARLENPIRTDSRLLEVGREAYESHDKSAANYLVGVDYTPVQRNKGVDGVLKSAAGGIPVFIRVQRSEESIIDTVSALRKSAKNKGGCKLIAIRTKNDLFQYGNIIDGVAVISASNLEIEKLVDIDPEGWTVIR